jgi:hypothetical protein
MNKLKIPFYGDRILKNIQHRTTVEREGDKLIELIRFRRFDGGRIYNLKSFPAHGVLLLL